jgi:hypothetical protein
LHLNEKDLPGDFPVGVHVPPGMEVFAFPESVTVRRAPQTSKEKP